MCIITVSVVINISWDYITDLADFFDMFIFSAMCAAVLVVVCSLILNEAAGDSYNVFFMFSYSLPPATGVLTTRYGGFDVFVTVTWLSLWVFALIRFGIVGYMNDIDLNYRPLGAYLVSSLFAFLITPPSSMEVLSGSVIPMVNETVLRIIPNISMIPQFDTFAIFTLSIILVSVPPTLFSDEGRWKVYTIFGWILSGMSLLLVGMWQLGGVVVTGVVSFLGVIANGIVSVFQSARDNDDDPPARTIDEHSYHRIEDDLVRRDR